MATPSTHNAMAAADPSPVPLRGTGDAGAALVELAMALPFLVTLLFGIYAVSHMYNVKTELTGAVREGARAAALRQSESDTKDAVVKASPGLTVPLENITVQPCAAPSATGDAVVDVFYDVNISVPYIPEDITNRTITAKGVMRCGL